MTAMILAQVIATIGFLWPVAIWVWLRLGRSGQGVGEGRFAVELALGVAVDLLSVLLLTRVFTLETSTLISRAVWTLGAAAAGARWWRTGGRPAWPDWARRQQLGALALVVLGAVALSMSLSRVCALWDREWHIPLVSALRGQQLPFSNVYVPTQRLFYHYAGDVQAAMLQTLSGGRLHASLALSLLHDIMFALIALNVVCFVRASGVKRTTLAAVVFFAVIMIGPVTVMRDDVHRLDGGFSILNYLTLSYRPHVALAYLLSLGFLQLVFTALLAPDATDGWRARVGGLVLLSAALVLADESSLGLLGLALGALWLAVPDVLAPTRRQGLLALGALLAAILLSILLFGGSLGPDAPHYQLSLIAPRAPGYGSPPLPLSTEGGRLVIAQDLLPLLGALASMGIMAARSRDRAIGALTIFLAALSYAAILTLTCLDFEGQSSENHRFATAAFIAAPLVLALAFERRVRLTSPGLALGGAAALMAYATLGLGVASTVEWLASGVAYRQCLTPNYHGFAIDRFYDVDCRAETGTRLGERSTPTYADVDGFYLWTGCHPTSVAAPPSGRHKIKVFGPAFGRPAYQQLSADAAPDSAIEVACLTVAGAVTNPDPACLRAPALVACTPRGTDFKTCRLTGQARAMLPAAM